ncbi:MAG: hypothetical protein SGI77_11775 [Pirellulaceae bacterium]|nr:hypothetical protein [Pirellulaceae bacterium]
MAWQNNEYVLGTDKATVVTVHLPNGIWSVTRFDVIAEEEKIIATSASGKFTINTPASRAVLFHFKKNAKRSTQRTISSPITKRKSVGTHMGTHTISIPDDSADAYSPLNGDFFSATNRIADKVLCPLGPRRVLSYKKLWLIRCSGEVMPEVAQRAN